MIIQFLFLFLSTMMTTQNYSSSQTPTTAMIRYGITPKEMRTLYELLATYNEKNMPEAKKRLPIIKEVLHKLHSHHTNLFKFLFNQNLWCINNFDFYHVLLQDLTEHESEEWFCKHYAIKPQNDKLAQCVFGQNNILLAKLLIEMGYGFVFETDLHIYPMTNTLSAEQQEHFQSIARVFDGLNYEDIHGLNYEDIQGVPELDKSIIVTYINEMILGQRYQPLRELLLLEPYAIARATGENFALQEMANAMENVFKPYSIRPILQFLVHTAPEKDKPLLKKAQIEYERYLNLNNPLWKSRMHEKDCIIRVGTKKTNAHFKVDLKSKYQDMIPEDIDFAAPKTIEERRAIMLQQADQDRTIQRSTLEDVD